MRAILAVACVGLAACATDNELQYRSTLQADTRGVALSDDGLTAYAAMVGTTCAIDTTWGCPVSDQDLPPTDERVVDHYLGKTLAQGDGELYFLDGDVWDASADLAVPGLKAARLSDVGVLALRGSETSCSFTAGETEVTVSGALCGDDVRVAVDRRGAIVAATSQGVFRADAAGVRQIAAEGDLVSVDAVLGHTYVAVAGRTQVTALSDDGAVLWVDDEPGPVQDVAVRGDKRDLLVLSEGDGGFGVLRRIDGETGGELSIGRLPDAHGQVVTSYNGRTVAIVTPTAVHHYELVVDGEPEVINDEDVTCGTIPTRESQGFSTD